MEGIDLQGHRFELLRIEKSANDCYLVQFAVDGKKLDPFYEPAANCDGMNEDQFLSYLKSQALGFADYMEGRV